MNKEYTWSHNEENNVLNVWQGSEALAVISDVSKDEIQEIFTKVVSLHKLGKLERDKEYTWTHDEEKNMLTVWEDSKFLVTVSDVSKDEIEQVFKTIVSLHKQGKLKGDK